MYTNKLDRIHIFRPLKCRNHLTITRASTYVIVEEMDQIVAQRWWCEMSQLQGVADRSGSMVIWTKRTSMQFKSLLLVGENLSSCFSDACDEECDRTIQWLYSISNERFDEIIRAQTWAENVDMWTSIIWQSPLVVKWSVMSSAEYPDLGWRLAGIEECRHSYQLNLTLSSSEKERWYGLERGIGWISLRRDYSTLFKWSMLSRRC